MKVANLVKAYVEKYKHMRKHKKSDGDDTREVENWKQATTCMTWTGLILAMNTMSEGIIDLQLYLIENEVQRSKSIIGHICGTFFWIFTIWEWTWAFLDYLQM